MNKVNILIMKLLNIENEPLSIYLKEIKSLHSES